MDQSELFAFVKSDSIKNLICAADIKNRSDIEKAEADGYSVGYTNDELKEIFPNIPSDKIWYNNGFHKTFYYDNEKLIIFPLNLYGKQKLESFKDMESKTIEYAETIENDMNNGDFYFAFIALPDKMRMEMLDMLVRKRPSEKLYEVFTDFYTTADYGCDALSNESIRILHNMKSEKQKKLTQKKLKNLPKQVTLYRGQGDKSSNWDNAVSWTTDINVANFFASRMNSHSASIIIAEVEKCNIIEFFESESECIVLPENTYQTREIEIYGMDFVEKQLPQIAYEYRQYRDMAYDNLDFTIDDAEHGRLHAYRVLMNALILSNIKRLSSEDTEMLCNAAVFHDTRKCHNGIDSEHGMASAEYYKSFAEEFPQYITYSKTAEQLIKYHCLPDEEGKQAMDESKHYLLDIFKDPLVPCSCLHNRYYYSAKNINRYY